MMRRHADKQMAWVISVLLHAAAFVVLAVGGVFTFLQHHGQAVPVDIFVYNDDAVRNAAASAVTSSEMAYEAHGVSLPAINETYTQTVQEERSVREVMAEQHVDAAEAREIVRQQRSESAAAVPNSEAAVPGTDTAVGAAVPGELGFGSGEHVKQEGETGNAGAQEKRPAKKARLLSLPDVHSFYPESLRKKNISGSVTVHVLVSAEGMVAEASVTESSGYAEMDEAAVQIAYQCQYEPAENEYGQPVAAERNMHIPFSLYE